MNLEQIVSFIQSQVKVGATRPEMEKVLLLNHVDPALVAEAFRQIENVVTTPTKPEFPPTIPTPPPVMPPPPLRPPMADFAGQAPRRSFLGRFFKWLTILILLIILAGGGVLAYGYFTQPPWLADVPLVGDRLWKPVPQIIAGRVWSALQNSASFTYKLTGEIKNDNIAFGAPNSAANFTADGAVNRTTNQFTLKFSTTLGWATSTYEAALEARVLGKDKFYLLIEKLPAIGAYDLSFLLNRWISIPPSEAKSAGEFAAGASPIGLPDASNIAAWPEQFFADFPFALTFIGREQLDGVATRHYRLIADAAKIKTLTTEATSGQLDLNILPAGDLWLGQKDYRPYRLTLTSAPGAEPATATFRFQFDLKNYDQPTEIAEPTSTLDFTTIANQVAGLIFGESASSSFRLLSPFEPINSGPTTTTAPVEPANAGNGASTSENLPSIFLP